MNKKLHELREEYKNIPIPVELDKHVTEALHEKPKKKRFVWPMTSVAAATVFVASVNLSPAAADTLSKIPGVKELVEVVTFEEVHDGKGTTKIDVATPKVSGLENQTLENNINADYQATTEKLYQEYKQQKGHFAVASDYKTITDRHGILSIEQTILHVQASGYEQKRYVTLATKNEALITLPRLFKDTSYIEVISEEIIRQMHAQMKADDNKIYFVNPEQEPVDVFKSIHKNQQFYINDKGKLVISFDEYDVAPGYMGAVQFVIPTKVIQSILVGDRYIR